MQVKERSSTRSFPGHVTAGGRYGTWLTKPPAVGSGVLGNVSVKLLRIQSFMYVQLVQLQPRKMDYLYKKVTFNCEYLSLPY